MACVIEELFRPHQTSCIIPHTLGTGKASDQTQLLKVSSPFIYCNKVFFFPATFIYELKEQRKKKLTHTHDSAGFTQYTNRTLPNVGL